MKKCKIEVLKTMFNADLADKYGVKGIGKCPYHNVGDVFYGDYANPMVCATKHGRLYINMYSLFLMVAVHFITVIGWTSPAWQFVAVMTDYAP